MDGLNRRSLVTTVALVCLAAGEALAQERVPAEPIPVEWPADTLAAPPDTTPAPPIVLPGVETVVEEEAEGFPWILEWPGLWGVTVTRYSRVDGAVPALGFRLEPRDPDRWPSVEARIGFATTRERVYGAVDVGQRLPLAGDLVGRIGVGWFHRSQTFDDWKVSKRENDLATFLVGTDLVDWWRERGWRFGLGLESALGDRSVQVEFLAAEQFSQVNRSPFVLFGDGDFRDNPPVAEGDLRSVRARYVHDTRDVQSPLLPSPGWVVTIEAESAVEALGGDLEFLRGFLDLRRYTRFGRDTWWDHRLVVHAGSDLPRQRLPVLGGAGSLRGFPAAAFVAEELAVQGSSELRLPLPVTDWIAPFFLSWHVAGLADVGTVDDELEEWHADVGLGLSGINIFSYLGVFVAQRITDLDESDAGPRVIVRLRRDF
ncbi:MAG: outer membrane protein assembly factor [Gemmatimonadetes bacterium]|nr:outer membrane protein assembly factor [Gemmatimonadota bacterium]